MVIRPLALAPVLAAALAAGPAQAAPTQPGTELLERYRPVLRYDASERFFAQPVSLPPQSAEVVAGDRVYGHLARQGEERWLQYWLFYADNPQDRGVLATGRHEGDWELIQLRLGARGRPESATLSQHGWAERCAIEDLDQAAGGPVVYVANGSHANYSAAGHHDRPFPDPTDEADGDGRQVRPKVTVIEDEHPRWVAYPGRWGTTEAGWVPGESSSPLGPRFQASRAWSEPSAYHRRARECGSGAPGRPLVAVAAGGLGGLAVIAGLLAWRRRAGAG